MNRYVVLQVVGMVATAIGAQGIIRLLIDHAHAGILSWLPGGFLAWLVVYAVVLVIGVLIAGWAYTRRTA